MSGFEFSEEWMNATLERQRNDPTSDIFVPATLSEYLRKNVSTVTVVNLIIQIKIAPSMYITV